MKETEKLKLKLPENSDWADIVALNDNFQTLDRWLEQLRSDIIAKLNDTPAKEHTHTRKDITDFPTSLPASDVYPWAKQPSKPAYTVGEVGAAPSGHTHDGRYYTEAEVNSLLSSIKNRLTKLEGSVDMAKLVYTSSCNGIGGSPGTYANADFIVVKPVGLVSSTVTSNASSGYAATTSQVAPSDGYKIMKGCSGQATVYMYFGGRNSFFSFSNVTVNYGSDGAVTFSNIAEYGQVYCNIEFYKQ